MDARCSVESCRVKIYARELCGRHYRQQLRTGAVQPDRFPTDCAVPACERPAVTRGWCHGHYLRWSRTGDVQADKPLTRPVRDVCCVEGCERGGHSAGMCRSHYERQRKHGDPMSGKPFRVVTGGGSISHGYWYGAVPKDKRHLVPPGRTAEFEHRLVMAEVLGRPLLAHDTVHHKNGDRLDNRPANLELWSTMQPKGQRVVDKIAWARALLALYDAETLIALGLSADGKTPPGDPAAVPEQPGQESR